MSNLTLGSLFDGSGGFPLAGMMAGITPIWASEIEPFPIRVTTKRIPHMKHYGDISKMNGGKIEPVDIITFGSPCQNLSLAGKREGLNGEKSSMFFEAIRVIKEMRESTNGEYPRWIVWENVPGAMSSSKGQDFRTVLEEICKIKDETVHIPMPEKKWTTAGEIVGNDYSVAYRILDAQYFGVPQRRRRIFLVADFAGECARKVLFESESVFGNFKKSLCSWQGTAGTAETGIGETGTICLNDQGGERIDVTQDKTTTLRAQAHHPPCVMFENHSQDTKNEDIPLYDKNYQNSTGVKVIFADGVTVDEFNIDASVAYKKDNCIYASLDKGVKISKNGENKDINITSVNVPAKISKNDKGATIKFCDGGMMTVEVAGNARTTSKGWETTQQEGKTLFRKYGKAETLKITK